ncbi:hypothetical protein A2U01_0041590, partial [Trifolium medium]|nr:hypothetical protein [Trifolium medium]
KIYDVSRTTTLLSSALAAPCFSVSSTTSRIGAFIGKSRFRYKSLQQLTDSKIRIDDAPLDCPARLSPSSLNLTVKLMKIIAVIVNFLTAFG